MTQMTRIGRMTMDKWYF